MNLAETQETTATMEETPKLPNHPLLSFSEDEFLSTIIKRLNPQGDLDDSQGFAEIMNVLLFNGHDVEELEQTSFYDNPVCGKCILGHEMYYICLDCDINNHPHVYSLFCEGCFEKSNHKRHRLYIMRDESGSANCDCGDAQSLKPEGFCSDHKSKPINIPELYENFPQELRVKWETLIKKSIYGVVSLFELKQHLLADDLMSEMLNFWIECYSEVNQAFLPILWTTLRGQFDSPWDLVMHDCEDLQAANNLSQEPHKCTCSLLGSLLKISNLINRENQGRLKKVLIDCVKDQDFLRSFSLEFIKYLAYFFKQQEPSDDENDNDNDNSLLLGSYLHLFDGDDVLIKVLNSGYFKNFMYLIKKVVGDSTKVNTMTTQTMTQIQQILSFFLMPGLTSARQLAQDENFMLQYLDVIMTFQMKFHYPDKFTTDLFDHEINYDALNETLATENSLCRPLKTCIKRMLDLPVDEQKKTMEIFLKHWEMNLKNAKAALEDGTQSFNSCLERLFCCMMINYMKEEDISTNNLEKIMKENFNSIGEVALTTIEGPLRTLGMIRYLHLTFNYKLEGALCDYYDTQKAFFEIDVVTTQMMMLLLKPEEGLFELLVENFFSYSPEIQQFFKDPNEANYEKKLLTVTEDFLYFLVFLMTDEICLLNIQAKYKKDNYEQFSLSSRERLVVKNLLVNILRGFYWTTSSKVTEIYRDFLMTEQEMSQILLEVTIKDEKNHKIRIKDEYEAGLNPYIFYRMPSIRQDMMETFTEKNAQKTNGVDLISGVLDKDAPQYLKEIQVRLFESNLPEFLIRYLKTANFKTGSMLIRLVLKLVLLNVQVDVEDSSSLLKQKIEENYLNDDFFNMINNLSMEESLNDCQNCIENIKKILKKIQNKTDDTQVQDLPLSPQKDEKKKLTAQERMVQLKQNFAQKQAAFAQNHQYLLQKSMSFGDPEEAKKDESLVCQHCMEKLRPSGQEYGLPIYINFTNNFYNGGEFVEQDYADFLKADWWPVISSCNHHYHRKCFESLSKAPKHYEESFLSNAYEAFCPLCKGLCNNFLSLNETERISEEEVPQDQQIHHQTFTDKIQKILFDLRGKLQIIPTELEESVPIEIIFERAYQYFIESFYLLENSENLKKSFELYLAFFKSFKNCLTKIEEDSLPLDKINSETEIIKLFSKNLQRTLGTKSDDASGKSELLAVLKNFILLRIIQSIAFNNSENSSFKLEDCLSLYQSDLKPEKLNQLVFPIQKIILSYAMNISIASSSPLSELLTLLKHQDFALNQEEYLTDLFRTVGFSSSFSEFIAEIFQELPSRPESEITFLNSLLFNKETLKSHMVKFSPKMIQLPENYLEFNTKYFPQKCNLCQKYSNDFCISICLICGDVMCTCYCGNDESQAGNLNRHAKKYHMGTSVFLDIQDLHQNFVNTPLNLSCHKKLLYVNQIGQDLMSVFYGHPKDIAKLDFAEFKVNQEYLKELTEVINQQALRKETVTAGLRNGGRAEDGFF